MKLLLLFVVVAHSQLFGELFSLDCTGTWSVMAKGPYGFKFQYMGLNPIVEWLFANARDKLQCICGSNFTQQYFDANYRFPDAVFNAFSGPNRPNISIGGPCAALPTIAGLFANMAGSASPLWIDFRTHSIYHINFRSFFLHSPSLRYDRMPHEITVAGGLPLRHGHQRRRQKVPLRPSVRFRRPNWANR
jgi:hypothetical protein